MGTLGFALPPKKLTQEYDFKERGLTSPDPPKLNRLAKIAVQNSCDYLVMEASSHAISQGRLDFLPFKVKLFTNLTQDHLDYHQTMEEYFKVKKSFFLREEFGESDYSAICIDNKEGRTIFDEISNTKVSFGLSEDSAVRGLIAGLSLNGSDIHIQYDPRKIRVKNFEPPGERLEFKASTSLPGYHNVLNVLGAVAVSIMEGISPELIKLGIPRLKKVPGRLERVDNKRGIQIFVDYAHTPDALKQVLKSLRNLAKDSRIICVFGCGGDRDQKKRPLMAQVAAIYSDAIIITSDNPRSEDPADIAEEIVQGLKGLMLARSPKYFIELDRKTAIRLAINDAEIGDIVLIAGKGHEDYQIFKDRIIHFSDVEAVNEILEEG